MISLSAAYFAACNNPPDPLGLRDLLVTENEMSESAGWTFEQHLTYADAEREFSDVIILDESNLYRYQPKFYLRTLDLDKKTVSHEEIPINRITMNQNTYVVYSHEGLIHPKDLDDHQIDEILIFKLQGIYFETTDIEISIRVKRDPIKVESVALSGIDGEDTIFSHGQLFLHTEILPANASFTNSDFFIERIIVNGATITDSVTISEYASVSAGGTLTTSNQMQSGDKIYVYAIADNVRSNTLEIKVI